MEVEEERKGQWKGQMGGGGLVTALFVELAQSEIMCDQNQCNKETRSI